ncbi:hypothetical protein ACS0TY_017735 [Phlomoides rotata]
MNIVVCGALFLVCFASANAQKSTAETPTPAPAPEPDHVNLTQLLSVAGPFHTFLNYLQSTKLSDEFQDQADNTEEGITIFVPKDGAFSSLKKPSLSNLTQDQLKSLIHFHALPHYYSLSDFRNLSGRNPVPTFAGGAYSLNFTDNSGTILIDSGWTRTKVISAVHASDPVAIYETDKVLLPEAIFGTDIPPMPAPAPAPETAPPTDAPAADKGKSRDSSSPKSSPSSSHKRMISKLGHVATAIAGGALMML